MMTNIKITQNNEQLYIDVIDDLMLRKEGND